MVSLSSCIATPVTKPSTLNKIYEKPGCTQHFHYLSPIISPSSKSQGTTERVTYCYIPSSWCGGLFQFQLFHLSSHPFVMCLLGKIYQPAFNFDGCQNIVGVCKINLKKNFSKSRPIHQVVTRKLDVIMLYFITDLHVNKEKMKLSKAFTNIYKMHAGFLTTNILPLVVPLCNVNG